MFKYICEDMMYALRYLPWGMLIGVPLAVVVLKLVDNAQKRHQKPAAQRLPVMLFCVYIAVMLVITFLSRENGSRSGAMDLQLFSTWGINARNNAFVVENVLLFMPYGFLYSWNFRQTRTVWRCLLLGAVTSFGIELMQLVTGRGYFQIDDILTNTLGALFGGILFWGVEKLPPLKRKD